MTAAWYWRFQGGPLDGQTVPTEDVAADPAPEIIAFHTLSAGWVPVSAVKESAAIVQEFIAGARRAGRDVPDPVRYELASASAVPAEQAEGAGEHFARGALYEVAD